MVFGHDSESALLSAVDLVNSAVAPNHITAVLFKEIVVQ